MTPLDVISILVGAIPAAFLVGVGFGLLLAREHRIYRDANRRGGDLDLTGRRT